MIDKINNLNDLQVYVKSELDKCLIAHNNVLNALQDYSDKMQDKSIIKPVLNDNGIRIEDIEKLLIKYDNLNYSKSDLSIVTGVINKRNLNLKEVDKKLSDISKYKVKNGVIKDLKLFTIKSINKYSEEKEKEKINNYL